MASDAFYRMVGFAGTSSGRGAPVSGGYGGGTSGWNAGAISPGILPTPPGFVTPEQIVQQAQSYSPTVKTFSAADFLTQPTQLSDPKLGSRPYSSVLTSTAINSPLSVSAYSNVPVPSFLTNAVNQLNASQSWQAMQAQDMRQQLLNAVLSGNYLAAEALRASVVSPGATVGFGNYVQNPQEAQASLLEAASKATLTDALRTDIKTSATAPQGVQNEIDLVQQQLSNLGPGGAFGPERARLTQKKFELQRQLENLQKAGGQKVNLNVKI